MGEVTIGAGDSVSRLLQVISKELGIKRVWNGNGQMDARMVLVDLHNAQSVKEELWKAITELYSMPELKELPESVQAKLMAIILARRANSELASKSYTATPKV